MKKLIVLLSVVVLLMTGCSVSVLSTDNISSNVKTILSEKGTMHNVHYEGYSYYVPKGLSFLEKKDYNATFIDQYDNKYYLYVDAISYYHKIDLEYDVDNSYYYSKKFTYNKKDGYLQIEKQDDGNYLVEFVFNYAKMEAYVSKKDLVNTVNNMAYLLRSIKFNRKVLESLIGENVLSYQEEGFNLFDDTDSSENDFLDVVTKYEENYNKSIDEDEIDIGE